MTEQGHSDTSAGARRQWTISGWHASTPGTGAVYVDGPTLHPGEAVTVTETHDQGAPMAEYTSEGPNILHGDEVFAVVPVTTPNAFEQAALIASELNGYAKDEQILESVAQAINDRNRAV